MSAYDMSRRQILVRLSMLFKCRVFDTLTILWYRSCFSCSVTWLIDSYHHHCWDSHTVFNLCGIVLNHETLFVAVFLLFSVIHCVISGLLFIHLFDCLIVYCVYVHIFAACFCYYYYYYYYY